jgi:signal transduction histidine kinase
MRQRLKQSLDEIEQSKSVLEEKVSERTQRLSELLSKVISAQEKERQRLAREVHDEQCQALGALSVMLDRTSRLVESNSREAKSEIEQARDMSRSLLAETRRLIYDLRPTVLDDMGLEAAIRWCVETHLESKGTEVAIQSTLPARRLPGAIEVALFRVAQEAIVNIKRHSFATHAGVLLEQEDSIMHMRVWDDGKGFVLNRQAAGGQVAGFGLQGMEERVRLLGGNLKIQSLPSKGTVIDVKVPLGQGGEISSG